MPPDLCRKSILRSSAFRFALLLAILFTIGSLLLLVAVEHQVGHYAADATDGMLRAEAGDLAAEYRLSGRQRLIDVIQRHAQDNYQEPFRYLLVDDAGHRIAGNLPADTRLEGWGTVAVDEHLGPPGTIRLEAFRTLATPLPGGLRLVVATDLFDVLDLAERLRRFTLASGIGIALFALAGGYFIGGLFLRRLDRVNAAVGRIMDGALTERLPTIGFSPEFDRLSSNLNRMLDRIGSLMEGLRQVSNDIAHDLRTPLTRLRQQLEQVRATMREPGGEARVDAAIEQTDEILRIFAAVLRIGMLESGAGHLRLAMVDLSEVMGRIHLAYRPVAEDAGKILMAQHESSLHVRGDADLLAQLFVNLIENAIMHTPPGTHIVTQLTRDTRGLIAEVADDGPGVPEEERTRITDRFYRLDRSRGSPGSGLGLALASAIATLHGGELTVHDNRPGLRISIAFPDRRDSGMAS